MFGVQILIVLTAYTVILLEVYSGAIKGPEWWVLPGALVIALLISLAQFTLRQSNGQSPQQGPLATLMQWILLLAAAGAMSYFANYMGRTILPDIYERQQQRELSEAQQPESGEQAAPPGILESE